MAFIIGQRWISNTESQLGLGIITQLNGRQVHIHFPAADEDRIYAMGEAPLCRIVFKEGEEILDSNANQLIVHSVTEERGLLTYSAQNDEGMQVFVKEQELHCFIQLNTPQQRLFSGLLAKLSAFKLRIETLHHLYTRQTSKAKGLIGSRTEHLPHQIYIAQEVANRFAPRVLLADEVGLGKTIECGMILHSQLHTGRASRVLIVVPAALIHQWFVEMRRRFNLNFSILDDTLFEDAELEWAQDNFFEEQQLILCSLEFLLQHPDAKRQAGSCEWDLLVVDEAHHLRWSAQEASPEYDCIEQIAACSKGVLLLTATPEQVGIESHFSRLRLLDPARFHDLETFKQEMQGYKAINTLIQDLLQSTELTEALKKRLHPYLGNDIPETIANIPPLLLDHYGTGRVFFRNSRTAISGFPERFLHQYPLNRPAIYLVEGVKGLQPELLVDSAIWLKEDPRVDWLCSVLKALSPQKILIICAQSSTAISLEQHLKLKVGIRSAAFHEGMSIIERDRAAAYFSEQDGGAQALICSEIGSEGRNFQFAHHLVLFDLPLNPDLLIQRIGRLDRIGQLKPIEIHVPYFKDSAQEVLFRWFHEGLDLFNSNLSVAALIFERLKPQLLKTLEHPQDLSPLLTETKTHRQELQELIAEGRDKLLEMNSCHLPKANELIDAIESEENSLELEQYMSKVFEEYGVEQERHSDQTEILRPSNHMQISHFPGLTEDEITVTYSRKKAMVREDMHFLSWEHPMVTEVMDMLIHSEFGNACLTTTNIKNIPPGTLFVECFYSIQCSAPKKLQLDRFLPLTTIRLFMDASGKNLSKILTYEQLNGLCSSVKRHLGYAIISQLREPIEFILKKAKGFAEKELTVEIEKAKLLMNEALSLELNRLLALQAKHASIREEEINGLKKQLNDGNYYLDHANLCLQAVRVVVNQ